MKLYVRTPAGTGLGINILFTGRLKESDGKVRTVEIALPIGVVHIFGYTVEPLPTTHRGRPLLWADPGDICDDDGNSVNHDRLRAEAARAVTSLGEGWS